jgi:uncharacterized membrane protein
MRLDPNLSEWLNLFARWFHVFAGILWIGTTYYFTWLDARLSEAEGAATAGDKPQIWMVHSGGFYVVEKQKRPGTQTLHWFRWEAALTWLSGLVLLVLVYYLGGALVDPDVRDISLPAAVAFCLGLLIVAWVVYDLLVRSPLGKNEIAFAAVAYALLVGVAYLLTHSPERARGLHSHGRADGNADDGQRLDADSSRAASHDRRHERGTDARCPARRSG